VRQLRFTKAADGDLANIWRYSARTWSVVQADRYVLDLRRLCHQLASGDRTGMKCSIRPGYLKARAGSHLIYFRMTATDLEIIRILHSKQDVERHL
jgi:toxin ParE1/3/4